MKMYHILDHLDCRDEMLDVLRVTINKIVAIENMTDLLDTG